MKAAAHNHRGPAKVSQPTGESGDVIRPSAIVPAVNVGNHERLRCLLDQLDRVFKLARVLIRALFAKLDECQRVTIVVSDRILEIADRVTVNGLKETHPHNSVAQAATRQRWNLIGN